MKFTGLIGYNTGDHLKVFLKGGGAPVTFSGSVFEIHIVEKIWWMGFKISGSATWFHAWLDSITLIKLGAVEVYSPEALIFNTFTGF